jgi:hypothetical protein
MIMDISLLQKMLTFFKVEDRTLKRHKSIGVFVVYIDTRSSMPNIPSKSRDLADANTHSVPSIYKLRTFLIDCLVINAAVDVFQLYHAFICFT